MVAEADGGYKSVSYSAPTEGSPLTVSAGEEIDHNNSCHDHYDCFI